MYIAIPNIPVILQHVYPLGPDAPSQGSRLMCPEEILGLAAEYDVMLRQLEKVLMVSLDVKGGKFRQR